jgi:hypothetical protein
MNNNGARWRCLWCLGSFPNFGALREHKQLCPVASAMKQAEGLRGRRLTYREMMVIRNQVRGSIGKA